MYSGGFYPYKTLEEYWAYWSRYVFLNRYSDAPKPVYTELYELVREKDYFVLTTNVDPVSYAHLTLNMTQIPLASVFRKEFTVSTAISAARSLGKRNSPVEIQQKAILLQPFSAASCRQDR